MSAVVLPGAERARLYAHLAAMLRAGLPLAEALAHAPLPSAAQGWRTACVQRMRAGQPLSAAARGQGVFGAEDWPLVQAGEATGALERIFERLAERHAGRSANLRSMRSRMMLPALVLLLALLIQPLPALVAGRIGIGEALAPLLATVLLMGVAVFFGRALLAWLLRPAGGILAAPCPARTRAGGRGLPPTRHLGAAPGLRGGGGLAGAFHDRKRVADRLR